MRVRYTATPGQSKAICDERQIREQAPHSLKLRTPVVLRGEAPHSVVLRGAQWPGALVAVAVTDGDGPAAKCWLRKVWMALLMSGSTEA